MTGNSVDATLFPKDLFKNCSKKVISAINSGQNIEFDLILILLDFKFVFIYNKITLYFTKMSHLGRTCKIVKLAQVLKEVETLLNGAASNLR